ncbi:MAG: histidine triad nucleotide-binding protein [Candidatus Nanopelagicales bacterium]
MTDCLFCAIAAGSIPADIVRSGERVIAFRDINPQAPVHVLVISRAHFGNAGDLAIADPALLGELVAFATEVAAAEELVQGYRLVVNTGEDGGQTVDHVHIHLLGGWHLTWPPG